MLTLADVRDYIKTFKLAENHYVGKLDSKKEKSIGVYQRKNSYAPRKCIGVSSGYDRKPVSVLVHWNKNARETEEQALLLYGKLEGIKDVDLGGTHILFADVLNVEPVDVGTDDDNEFKIGLKGLDSTEADMAVIAEVENFAPSIEGGVEEWNAMDAKGWGNAMMTSKKLSFSFSGKRAYGDPGNDYVAGLAWKSGNDVVTLFEWTMPSGAVVTFECVVNTTTPGGGDSTAVEALEFEILCKGKPTYIPAA